MLVKESIDFKRGMGSKSALGVGIDNIVDSIMKRISGDYQLDPTSGDDYLGFLNVDGEDFQDLNELRAYKAFINNPRDFQHILDKYELYTEELPQFDETVFVKEY